MSHIRLKQVSRNQSFRLSKALNFEAMLKASDTTTESVSIPKSEWLGYVLKNHPEVVELRERLLPLTNETTYGRVLGSSRTTTKESLPHYAVLQLIISYLQDEGLEETAAAILKESGFDGVLDSNSLYEGGLVNLLKVGVRDTNNLFERSNMDQSDNKDPDVEQFDFVSPEVAEEEEDVNIWEEENDSNKQVIFVENTTSLHPYKELVAGSLNQLVLHLTDSPKEQGPTFELAFLMTHHTFTTSEKLLQKLFQRFNVPPEHSRKETASLHSSSNGNSSSSSSSPSSKELKEGGETKQNVRYRVIKVLTDWINNHHSDFISDKHALSTLNNFIDNTLNREWSGAAKKLRQCLNKPDKVEKSETITPTQPPDPIIPPNIFSPTLTLNQIDEEEISRQLSIMDFNIYSNIQGTELVSKNWLKSKNKSPNVIAMLKRFNDITRWTCMSILSEPVLKQRARVYSRFIRICECLRMMKSFNMLRAIWSGLNCSAVYRLKWTRNEVKEPKLLAVIKELEGFWSPKDSYGDYRDAYADSTSPSIPWLGIHLRDILITEEVESDFNSQEMINFSKRQKIYNFITDILRHQNVPYNFHYIHQIGLFLDNFDGFEDEEGMYKLSLQNEPQGFSREQVLSLQSR